MRLGFTPRSFRPPRPVNIAIGLTAATLVVGFIASLLPEALKAREVMTMARWLFANNLAFALLVASLFAWLLAAVETLVRHRRRRQKPSG